MKAIIKRWLGLCVLVFLCTLHTNADTYNFTFNIDDFEIIQQDNIVSIHPLKSSYTFDWDSSLPALPYFTQQILIDGICKPETFTFDIEGKVLIASDIYVCPNQESIPINGNATFSVPLMIKPQYSETVYPDITVKYMYGMTDREGKEHSFLVISPFEYDAERNCLYFIPSIRISYDIQPISSLCSQTRINNNESIKYLIITADSLVDAYRPMRNWKRMKAIETEIITTETINSTYSGNSLQEKIKHCLKDYYDNYGLEWVLLGGDETIVPTRMCYINSSGSDNPNNNYATTIASDTYYANFEGAFDWNADNDNTFGEISDNIYLTSQINVSRLPIRTIADVEKYVEKLIKYEKGDNWGVWMKKILLLACKIKEYNDEGLSDSHVDTEKMFEDFILPYFDGIQKCAFYDTGNNLGYTDDDSILNKANLLRAINSIKPHYMHIKTHGLLSFVELDEGIFQAADVQSITNAGTPMIITSEACYSNDFTCFHDPGFSEAFIRKENTGALAFWGSTHNGWTFLSTKLCGAFWKFMGVNSKSFTDAIAYSKTQYIPFSNKYSHMRSLLLSMNAVGDSELRIYRPNSTRMTAVDVTITPSNVLIYSDYNAPVVIASKEDAGESLFYKSTRGGSVETSIPLSICLSWNEQNYIPFYMETGRYVITEGKSSLYLQNLKLSGRNISYSSDYTKIGKEIDDEQEIGVVTVQKGTCLNIESTNSTTIDKGFKCEKGGKLIIK